ncbi:MAG: 50S ribosomal protein L18 [Micavibrio sp.]|jgi:large subunit ribosomal protein L18|nr:MAG: 50S ribosomal protein L18 [Micavibrio sp.]
MNRKPSPTQKRKWRTRAKLRKSRGGHPRLSIHRTGLHIYAQVIDDVAGRTLAAASTVDKELRGKLKKTANKDAAAEVGKLVAKRATKAGVTTVMFDRGSYAYHGRVQALADGAREGGLAF